MTVTKSKISQAVEEIFSLYQFHGDEDYIGEPVTQLEHMSQAAALAEAEGYEDEVILAAFFHDIGHLCCADKAESMDGFGTIDHEHEGAAYLAKLGFSERLVKLVKSHVAAKLYLTYKHQEYYDRLSDASKATLVFQGGMMNPAQAWLFESDPDFELMLHFRYWDDEAKKTNTPFNNLESLKQKAIVHLERNLTA